MGVTRSTLEHIYLHYPHDGTPIIHPTLSALQSQSVTIRYQMKNDVLCMSIQSGTCVVNNVMIPLFIRVWFQHVLLFSATVEPFTTCHLPPFVCSLNSLEIQVSPLACSSDRTRASLLATRMEKRPKGFSYSALIVHEEGVYHSCHQEWVREVDEAEEEEYCEGKNDLSFIL